MKLLKTALITATAAAALSGAAMAQSGPVVQSAPANANATVVTAITITPQVGEDLVFGEVAANSVGGQVVVNPATGIRSGTGSELFPGGSTGGGNAAKFDITGQSLADYIVTLPISVIIDNGAGATMTVDNFTFVDTNDNGQIDTQEVLSVGGTLNIGANQAAGTYTAPFTVSVQYQ